MGNSPQGYSGGPRHGAYRRITRSARRDFPAEFPAESTMPAADRVCPRCRTWESFCFCTADVEAMRAALRRIAELHSGCDRRMCPEGARLAAIPRGARPQG